MFLLSCSYQYQYQQQIVQDLSVIPISSDPYHSPPPMCCYSELPRAASADDGQGSLDLVSPMYSWLPCAALVSLHPTVVGKGEV